MMQMILSEHREQFKKIGVSILIALIIFFVSKTFFNTTQSLLLGLIALLVTLWTNEGLPLAVVSLLPIILFPSFEILTTKMTTINYAHPIIFLFLGGFLLAIGVEKTNLHTLISRKMFTFFPNTPRGIIFSLAITSGLLSSILSNTTTTLLLISIALFLTNDAKLKMRFVLAIAYGASIGGILTPIGTPPNLILMGIMSEKGMDAIPFFQWIIMALPLVLVMFGVVAWLLSIGTGNTPLNISKSNSKLDKNQKKIVFILLGLIVLLLLNAPMKPFWNGLGLSESGLLLFAGLLLLMPPFNILNWDADKHKIPYQIIFLFGAGFSIAKAFSSTGLAEEVASHLISIAHLNPIILLFLIALLITFTTEITSNTALISIMLPVMYSVAQQTGINASLYMMTATVCASYAFMLPIATAPNAIAMSSGVVSVKNMIRYGIILNLIGIFCIVLIAEIFWANIL